MRCEAMATLNAITHMPSFLASQRAPAAVCSAPPFLCIMMQDTAENEEEQERWFNGAGCSDHCRVRRGTRWQSPPMYLNGLPSATRPFNTVSMTVFVQGATFAAS